MLEPLPVRVCGQLDELVDVEKLLLEALEHARCVARAHEHHMRAGVHILSELDNIFGAYGLVQLFKCV